jgi:hypothetical protein
MGFLRKIVTKAAFGWQIPPSSGGNVVFRHEMSPLEVGKLPTI